MKVVLDQIEEAVEAAVVVCEVDVVVDAVEVADHTEVTKAETSNKVMGVMEEAKGAMVVVIHKAMVTKEGMADSLKGMVTKVDTVNRETKVDTVKETKVDITKETKVVDTIKEVMVLEGMVNNNNHSSNSTQHHIPLSNKVMEEVTTTITVVVILTVMVLVVEVPVEVVLVVVTDMHPTKL